MSKSILNVGVILAGGTGERAGFSRPKQLIKLAGRPVVAHAIQAFQLHSLIDEIAIVSNPDCLEEMADIVNRFGFTKVKRMLQGGAARHHSSLSAIRAYERPAAEIQIRLIFHDAVRPLLNEKIITDVIKALDHYNAVDVVIVSPDTVVQADTDTNTIAAIPARAQMRLGQTPQGFAYETIKLAYERALKDPSFQTTDDCGVVLKYVPEERIYLVDGAVSNMKLTFANDLLLLDKLVQCNVSKRLDAVGDNVLLRSMRGKVLVCFGGTSGIGAEMARLAKANDARVYIAGRSTGMNIAVQRQVAEFLDGVAAKEGKIDAVINTAAVLNRQPLAHMSDADVLESTGTNFIGAVAVARAAHDHLARSRGHLLMFASSSYTYGRAHYSLYSASKAAVVNLTQALADEWESSGIKVNCINPERTRTPMRVNAFGIEPAGSLLEPDFVARKALGVLAGATTGYVYDISKT